MPSVAEMCEFCCQFAMHKGTWQNSNFANNWRAKRRTNTKINNTTSYPHYIYTMVKLRLIVLFLIYTIFILYKSYCGLKEIIIILFITIIKYSGSRSNAISYVPIAVKICQLKKKT